MAYARTGVARVGTAAARYLPELRGFLPESDADPFAICVSPARYAAYLAVPMKGSKDEFRPMRFRDERRDGEERDWVPDNKRDFWVPVHKLFRGRECIRDVTVKDVVLEATLINEKIYRIQKIILGKNPPSTPPFRLRTGRIASFSMDPDHGAGVLVPKPQPLVAKAELKGKLLTFRVPGGADKKEFDALRAKSPAPPHHSPNDSGEFRHSPEYVHIRTLVRKNQEIDLNELDDAALKKQINAGDYDALHYLDFTGDGWVGATVNAPALRKEAGVNLKAVPAYALVTAPDFFPTCDQRQLTVWTDSNAVPTPIQKGLWNVTPDTLADVRLAANIQLEPKRNPFLQDDATMTALVSLFGAAPSGPPPTVTADAMRHSHLPDDAAGVFAPGWDVTRDWTHVGPKKKVVWHLANYGLGSPFPEDAKLCAALSTFWPAVAPDATREMEPIEGNQSGTVSPLTDQEIGQVGGLPWDGVPGPQVVTVDGEEFAEYASFRHVDYVRNALANLFTLRLTARVDAKEYEHRVLAAAFAYLALGFERTGAIISAKTLTTERGHWKMLSFQNVAQGTPELERARLDAQVLLPGNIYRIEFFPKPKGKPLDVPGNFRKKRLRITQRFVLFVDPVSREAAVREASQLHWHKGQFVV
jgi:hypothetical protein